MTTTNIFVYGTLKKGHGNHGRFFGGKDPLHVGTVKGRLYVSGLPYLRPGDKDVHGEVYAVDDKIRNALDSLEGHPTWYKRTPVEVTLPGGGRVTAEAYVYQREMDEKYHVADGNYRTDYLRTARSA